MKSELTTFLTTIDTPEFRRSNMAKVRAKAAAAHGGPTPLLSALVPVAESVECVLSATRLQAIGRTIVGTENNGKGL